MNHEALATPLQGIFILLTILVQCVAIDIHGKFEGAIDSSDGHAAFLGSIG